MRSRFDKYKDTLTTYFHNVIHDEDARREFYADTTASVLFGLGAGSLIELGWAKMPFPQYLRSRFAMTGVNMLIGPLYGQYRNERHDVVKPEGLVEEYRLEIDCIAKTWIIPYGLGIAAMGADVEELFRAVTLNWAAIPVYAIVVPWFTDKVRGLFDVPPARSHAQTIYSSANGDAV